jgi:protein deglycase
MVKKALVALAQGFEELEAVAVIDVLRRGGVEVTAVGVDSLQVKSSRKITFWADKQLKDCGDDFDAVALPGGMPGAANLAVSKELNALLKKFNAEKKIIAAICAAPSVVLAPLGILDNKNATCYPGDQKAFSKTTVYKEDNVVIDDNAITSRGPATALEFGFTILEKLTDKNTADKIRKAMLVV